MIETIELSNWRSHEDTELSFQSGVNGIVGAMGAGKSSVLEALTYGLYGTIPAVKSRRITLDDLIRRHPVEYETATVTVTFTVDGTTYEVERTLKRGDGTDESLLREEGSLIAGPQTGEVTDAVTDILGIGFELFTTIVYAEQNQMDFFLDLAPSDRREMIDTLLHLDRFEEARSNLVSLRNTIKSELDATRDRLKDETEAFDAESLSELRETIETKKEELEDKQEEQEAKREQLEDLTEAIEELEEKQEQDEHLDQQINRLEGTIESLQNDIEQLEDETDAAILSMNADTIEEQLDQIEEAREEWQRLQDRRDTLTKEHASLQQKIETLENKFEDLNEQKEKIEDLESVEERYEDLKDKKDAITEKIQAKKATIEQLEEQRADLEAADQQCPVCERPLDDEHRESLLEATNTGIEQAETDIDQLEEEKEQLEQEIEEVSERRDELLQYQGVDEKIEETEENRAETQEKCAEIEDELEDLEEQRGDLDPETLQEKRSNLQDAKTYLEKKEKYEKVQDRIEEMEEQREELAFDPDTLEAKKDTKNEIESRIEVLRSEIESTEDLIEEKEQRLEQLEEQKEQIKELEAECEKLEGQLDFLATLENALEETQEQMRKEFVTTTNEVMERVWNTVYPYHDYETIRLDAGEDYRLVLEDQRGETIPVEGEVSGGERHTAAFTLRIALATVLTPDTRLLILDEPTHNLDEQAIEQLGETLRNTVDGYMDQVFLITHDEELESAVTGSLYRLQNTAETNGVTRIDSPYQD